MRDDPVLYSLLVARFHSAMATLWYSYTVAVDDVMSPQLSLKPTAEVLKCILRHWKILYPLGLCESWNHGFPSLCSSTVHPDAGRNRAPSVVLAYLKHTDVPNISLCGLQ